MIEKIVQKLKIRGNVYNCDRSGIEWLESVHDTELSAEVTLEQNRLQSQRGMEAVRLFVACNRSQQLSRELGSRQ